MQGIYKDAFCRDQFGTTCRGRWKVRDGENGNETYRKFSTSTRSALCRMYSTRRSSGETDKPAQGVASILVNSRLVSSPKAKNQGKITGCNSPLHVVDAALSQRK